MVSWLWLLVVAPLSAGLGAWIVGLCVASARRREAAEYDLTLRRIARARRAEPPHGYCQTREHAERLAASMAARTRRRGE